MTATRAKIIELMLSDSMESETKLMTWLQESMSQPAIKLVSVSSVKTIRVSAPTRWMPPPAPKTTPVATLGTVPVLSLVPTLARSIKAPGIHAGSEKGTFCICGNADDDPDETFVKCSVGTGGCNGWVHLRCTGLPESEIDEIFLTRKQPQKYVCRLCVSSKPRPIMKRSSSTGQTIESASDDHASSKPKMARSTSIQTAREALLKKMKPTSKKF